jgi:hypothetical protein
MKNYSVLVVDDEVLFLEGIKRCFSTEVFQRMVFDPIQVKQPKLFFLKLLSTYVCLM